MGWATMAASFGILRPEAASLTVGTSWYWGLDVTRFVLSSARPWTLERAARTRSLATWRVDRSPALTSTCICLLLAFELFCACPTPILAGPSYALRDRCTPASAVLYCPFCTSTNTEACVGSAALAPRGGGGCVRPARGG